jgi:hypothetical protein
LRVTVLAYNYSGVSQSVLAETATEVVRIYRPAEIEIAWVDLPAMPEVVGRLAEVRILPGPTRLAIRIVPKTMADRLPAEQNRFGFTIYPEDGGFAHFAYVFSDNAEQLANLRKTSYGVILGHLVAHELGHMLLGVGSHSAAGIMHVPWRYKELGTIQRGQMMFSSEQAQRMRMSVRARIALEETNGC